MTLRDWFPVITLILGSTLTIIGGLVSERSRAKASAALANREREIQDTLTRTTFQRDNILQLQDAGQDLIKLTVRCFDEKWPDDQRPTVDLDRRMARIQVNKLTSRLLDEQARNTVYALLELSHEVIDCDDFKIAKAKLAEMLERLNEANEKILGRILRETFPDIARAGNALSKSDDNPEGRTLANNVSSSHTGGNPPEGF